MRRFFCGKICLSFVMTSKDLDISFAEVLTLKLLILTLKFNLASIVIPKYLTESSKVTELF